MHPLLSSSSGEESRELWAERGKKKAAARMVPKWVLLLPLRFSPFLFLPRHPGEEGESPRNGLWFFGGGSRRPATRLAATADAPRNLFLSGRSSKGSLELLSSSVEVPVRLSATDATEIVPAMSCDD